MDSKALVTGSVGFVAGIVATLLVGFLAMAGMMRGGMMQGSMMGSGECRSYTSPEMSNASLALIGESAT